MTAQLSPVSTVLHPKTIAIAGDFDTPTSLGAHILRNIILSDYKGQLFPISSTTKQVYDFDVYPSVESIPYEIDLVIIALPSDQVFDVVYACTKATVRSICITSGGFAEVGQAGLVLQRKIRRVAHEAGIRIIGPNSLGIISTSEQLNATFGPSLWTTRGENIELPKVGKTAFMSQSGALINAFIEFSQYYSLGVSEIVGLGNKSDLDEIELLEYYQSLREDGRPHVVGAYLENISDGSEFLDVARNASGKFPIVMLSPLAASSMSDYIYAHSGSVLQGKDVVQQAYEQAGVIQATTQQQLYDLLLGFSWQPVPRGNNTAVISNAGGGLMLAIDQFEQMGLNLVNFSSDIKTSLVKELNWKEKSAGVVDIGGDALSTKYLKALDIVLGDHDVNAVLVIMSPQVMTDIEEIAETVGRLARQHGKTIVAAFMGYDGVEQGIKSLAKYHIPTYNDVDRAVYTLSKMYQYHQIQERGTTISSKFSRLEPLDKSKSVKVFHLLETARREKQIDIGIADCVEILDQYDIDTGPISLVREEGDLIALGKAFSYPIDVYTDSGETITITNKKQVKKFFQYNKHLAGRMSVAKTVFSNARKFTVLIEKDTYYDHTIRGLTVKELKKLSFGYVCRVQAMCQTKSNPFSFLIPASRDLIEVKLRESNILSEFNSNHTEERDSLELQFLTFIQQLLRFPHEFNQVASIEVTGVVTNKKVIATDCRIKMDLIG